MDCKQVLNLRLYFAKPKFFIGDFIKGTLLLESQRPSIIEKIIIEVLCVENWTFQNNNPVAWSEVICSFNLDLNNGKSLTKIQDCYMMPGGQNKIPFNFKINKQLLPSFEFPLLDKFSFLRYHFNVKIYSSSFIKLIWNHYLCLLARPIINLQKQVLTQTIQKSLKKWGLVGIGTTKLTVSIPQNDYKVNSEIQLTVVVDNKQGKEAAKEAKVKLSRIIEFYGTKNEVRFKDETAIFEALIKTPVAPGQTQAFNCVIYVREKDVKRYIYNKANGNPYDLKMNDILNYMPSIQGRVFSCKYQLKVSLYFNTFVAYNDRPRAIFPIYLVHQTFSEFQADIQRQIEQDKNIVNNDNNVPSFVDVNNNINNNKSITLAGNNVGDGDYSNQYECAPVAAPVAFQGGQNNNFGMNNNNNNIINQNPPPPNYANNNFNNQNPPPPNYANNNFNNQNPPPPNYANNNFNNHNPPPPNYANNNFNSNKIQNPLPPPNNNFNNQNPLPPPNNNFNNQNPLPPPNNNFNNQNPLPPLPNNNFNNQNPLPPLPNNNFNNQNPLPPYNANNNFNNNKLQNPPPPNNANNNFNNNNIQNPSQNYININQYSPPNYANDNKMNPINNNPPPGFNNNINNNNIINNGGNNNLNQYNNPNMNNINNSQIKYNPNENLILNDNGNNNNKNNNQPELKKNNDNPGEFSLLNGNNNINGIDLKENNKKEDNEFLGFVNIDKI